MLCRREPGGCLPVVVRVELARLLSQPISVHTGHIGYSGVGRRAHQLNACGISFRPAPCPPTARRRPARSAQVVGALSGAGMVPRRRCRNRPRLETVGGSLGRPPNVAPTGGRGRQRPLSALSLVPRLGASHSSHSQGSPGQPRRALAGKPAFLNCGGAARHVGATELPEEPPTCLTCGRFCHSSRSRRG